MSKTLEERVSDLEALISSLAGHTHPNNRPKEKEAERPKERVVSAPTALQ